jgi:acyl carrier protein
MTMSVRLTVLNEIEQVAKQQNKKLRPLDDDLALLDSGLDSLCLATRMARLEDKLGCDPFSASDDVEFPVTLGEFIAVYENAKLAA